LNKGATGLLSLVLEDVSLFIRKELKKQEVKQEPRKEVAIIQVPRIIITE